MGTTSSHHGLYDLGHTRPTMGCTKGSEVARRSQSSKATLSSDCGLQFAHMKLESLVIADQPRRGEYVLGPCTHRPSRHGSLLYRKSVRQPAREAAAHGMAGDWGEVVTR